MPALESRPEPARAAARRRVTPKARMPEGHSGQAETREIQAAEDDVWSVPAPTVPTLDASTFRRSPFDRPRLSMDIESKVKFELRDSSLMGRLNQMTQASVCGELRRALRSGSGEDASAIIRTMQERGCRV